jgi:hypothetical protein
VIYHDGSDGEHQATVVTVRGGTLAGKRIVRGREEECSRLYREQSAPGPATDPAPRITNASDSPWREKENPEIAGAYRNGMAHGRC